MQNLILFINAFFSYLLVFVVIIILVIVAILIGVRLRKAKDAKAGNDIAFTETSARKEQS